MYLVACTLEGGTMVYRLHAVDITNGTEPYTNVVISGGYGGVTFNPAHQTQRASLALSGGQVVFGFAAVEAETDDEGGYTGWVMAYNKQTLAQSGAFASVTTGGTLGGGVWQSGRATGGRQRGLRLRIHGKRSTQTATTASTTSVKAY